MNAADPPLAGTTARRLLITVSVMLATAIYVLDLTIISVALPHMQGSFSANTDEIAWVVTSYIVATVIVTPCVGALAARLGRRRLFLAGLAGFTFASLMCGAAGSVGEEVFWRAVQGATGAPFIPLSQAIMLDSFPRERHATATAIWAMGLLLGQIAGPAVGGWITAEYTWPWVFWINVPICVAGFAMVAAFVPDPARPPPRRFDWTGFAGLAVAIAALQTLLDRGDRLDWFSSPEIVVEATLVGLGLWVFLVRGLTATGGVIDPAILADRNTRIGMIFIFCYGLFMYWPLVLIPLMLYDLAGWPVLTIGLVMTMRGVGALVGMSIAGRLDGRIDLRWLLALGFLAQAGTGFAMARWTVDIPAAEVLWTGLLFGLGVGLSFVPISTATFATLPASLRTEASALFNLMRSLGTSIGLSAVITAVTVGTRTSHAVLAEHVTAFTGQEGPGSFPEIWNPETAAGLAALNEEVIRQATMVAYTGTFHIIGLAALAVVPCAIFLRSPRPGGA